MLADRLDRVGDHDLALVEIAEAGRRDRVRDVGGLDGAEEAPVLAGLDGQLHPVGLEDLLGVLSLFDGLVLAGGTSGLDLLDLLLAATAPRDAEALRDEVVAGVPVLT